MIEGVAMNALIKDARPPGGFRRIAGPAVRVLTQALVLLAGLAATVLGFTWFVDAYDAVGAYRHAPVCGTAAATPGTDCLLHETGKVTARAVHNSDDGTSYELTVARETAPSAATWSARPSTTTRTSAWTWTWRSSGGGWPNSPTRGTVRRTRSRRGRPLRRWPCWPAWDRPSPPRV
ncbi:hypothetical protein ACFQ0M_03115 [Kitasatospora aburaviensis]